MEHIETLFQAIGYYVLIGIALGIILVFVATWADFIFSRGVSFITDGDVKPKSYIAKPWHGICDCPDLIMWSICYSVPAGGVLLVIGILLGEIVTDTPILPALSIVGGIVYYPSVYIGIPFVFMLLLRGIYRSFKNMLKAHTSDPNAHK